MDFKAWWPKFFKKTCLSNDSYGKDVHRDSKRSFSLSKYHHLCFSYEAPFEVNCGINVRGLLVDDYRLRNTIPNLQLPDKQAYSGRRPINIRKMEDIKKSLAYVPQEKWGFWNDVITWTVTSSNPDED